MTNEERKMTWSDVAQLAIVAAYNAFLLGGTIYLIGWQGWDAWWIALPLILLANYKRGNQ